MSDGTYFFLVDSDGIYNPHSYAKLYTIIEEQ